MSNVITTPDIVIALVAFLVIYVTHWFVKRWWRYRGNTLPPGPVGWPLVGHVGSIHHKDLYEHRDLYGDVTYISIMGTDIVVLNSISAIRDAFQGSTAEVFSGRPPMFVTDYILADDVVFRSINSPNWKPLRRLFHSLLKQYGEEMVDLEEIVTQELEVVIEKLDKHVGEPIDIDEYLRPSLVNILCILLVGERFPYDHWKIQCNIEAIVLTNKLSNPAVDMILKNVPILMYLPFGIGATLRQARDAQRLGMEFIFEEPKAFSDELNGQLKARLDKVNGQPTVHSDKVNGQLKASSDKLNGQSKARPEQLNGHTGVAYAMLRKHKVLPWLTDSMIKGVLQNIIGAGFLTSYASLKAFFLIMLHYPDIQTQIQNEIDDVVGDERRPCLSDRGRMPYVSAVILELFRYASVLPQSIPHACLKQTHFHGFTIPEGAIILPNLFRVHHDEELWVKPWDFNPSRFLDESGELISVTHPNRQNLIPFGVGKRVCIGEVFAKTRLFLYITSLLQHFTLQSAAFVPSCDPRNMLPEIVIAPAPYDIRLERRSTVVI